MISTDNFMKLLDDLEALGDDHSMAIRMLLIQKTVTKDDTSVLEKIALDHLLG